MSRRTARAVTPYGPVELPLIECEECQATTQEALVVGWLKLMPESTIDIATMSQGMAPLDFCSLACLAKAVKTMTGE